jgi:NACalpha-BTF3-like transcription factor
MSNDAGFDTAGAAAGSETPADNGGGESFNPAWQPLVEKLPEGYVPMIAPTLREWDSNFQKVQTEYAPWKQFTEQGVAPDQVQTALQVANLLQTNPRFVYDKMMEQYGEEWGVNSVQGTEEEEFDEQEEGTYALERDPAFQQTQAQLGAIAQFQQAQMEQQARAQIDAEIDRDFKKVSEKYGELSQDDISMIVSVATSQNLSVPQAAEKVFTFAPRQQGQQQQSSLPNVVPPGGGMPAAVVNPANLNGQDTRRMVENILRNANNGG